MNEILKVMVDTPAYRSLVVNDIATRIGANWDFLVDEETKFLQLFQSVGATEDGAELLAMLVGMESLEDFYEEVVEILQDEELEEEPEED